MSTKRLYMLLVGSAALSVAVIGGSIFLANSILQGQAQGLKDARLVSNVLDEKQQQLTIARASVTRYQSLGDIAKRIVPQDKDQAQAVREIVAIAGQNNIKLGAITFPSSSLGSGVGAAKDSLSQLKAVKTIPGVYSLEITVQSDTTAPVPYDRFVSFLDALEHNRRTALVSGIAIVPDSKDQSKLTFTLNLSEYIKP